MTILGIQFDWYFTPEGEKYKKYKVGSDGVVSIVEHSARGDGDRWYYDVYFKDGHIERIFNVNKVFMVPSERV